MEVYPNQQDVLHEVQSSDPQPYNFVSTLRDQMLHDGEFISFVFELDNIGGCLFFLGMYGGRPWIDASPCVPERWLEEVYKKRRIFEAATGDDPVPAQQNHFTDHFSIPIEEGRALEALARKTRSEGILQWYVEISIKDTASQVLLEFIHTNFPFRSLKPR